MEISSVLSVMLCEIAQPIRRPEQPASRIWPIAAACFATLGLGWYFLQPKVLLSAPLLTEPLHREREVREAPQSGFQENHARQERLLLEMAQISKEELETPDKEPLPTSTKRKKMPIRKKNQFPSKYTLQIDGALSMEMDQFLARFPHFDGSHLHVFGKEFVPLKGRMTDASRRPIASCGGFKSREITLLDPDHSPVLKSHVRALQEELLEARANGADEEKLLKILSYYVRKKIFSGRFRKKSVDEFEAFLKETHEHCPTIIYRKQNKSYPVPLISIDQFIIAKRGESRQHSLVTFYLLDHFTQEPSYKPIFYGSAQHMRDNILRAGGKAVRTWVTFMSACTLKKWHIDSFWTHLVDFSDLAKVRQLSSGYGESVICRQIKRTEAAYQRACEQHQGLKRREGICRELHAVRRHQLSRGTSLVKAIKFSSRRQSPHSVPDLT